MDVEELEARLNSLEQNNLTRSFIDKYGSKFSGDEGIGVAVLAELQRRGIDTSAADEAVQEILDQIRVEATQLLDKINAEQKQVSDLMDKVETIDEAVSKATGQEDENPDAGAPPPDAGLPPDAGAPPPDAGLPPDQMLSDRRAKTIKSLLQKKAASRKGWSPASHLVSACKG